MSRQQSDHILVTGGAGYIGSHVCVALLAAGFRVVVLDNLDNSSPRSLERIKQITNREVDFVQADVRDADALDSLFKSFDIAAVVHCAGLKAVGESVANPAAYYNVNVYGAMALTEAMAKADVKCLLFSSSATVYGDPDRVPIDESFPLRATNPYGRTKLFVEHLLNDLADGDPSWRIMSLRYFNPVGAHISGRLGEDPTGIPNNLFPFLAQVAVGRRPHLSVFGNDYPTRDGTGVRDYIHVEDLAQGHLKALRFMLAAQDSSAIPRALNLGTGKGYSVLECLAAFEQAVGHELAHQITDRRPGDIAECFADPQMANKLLDWRAEMTLEQMCQDHWRWQKGNPNGYEG